MLNHLFVVIVLLLVCFISVSMRKLDLPAAITAFILATIIYIGAGLTGIYLLGAFFFTGIAATSWKKELKQQKGFADPKSTRSTGQVLANGGMAGVLSIMALLLPEQKTLLIFLMACSFSSAIADTVSSELGFIYGRRCFDILSFKRHQKGENGVISLEGTLLGIAASSILALVFYFAEGPGLSMLLFIIIAGTAGNITDSILGATLERRKVIGNNTVNFINTLAGAITGWLIYLSIK